jgi:hypothetical protein
LVILGNSSASRNDKTGVPLQDVSRCIKTAQLIAKLPEPFHRKFINFQLYWNTLFASCVAAGIYLNKKVHDMETVTLVELFCHELMNLTYTIVLQAYRIRKDMAEYCTNMIINWKRSAKMVDPVLLELVDLPEQEPHNLILRRCGLTDGDPKRALYIGFQDSTKLLFEAIVHEAQDGRPNKEETVKLLSSTCSQLLAYEAKIETTAEEKVLVGKLRSSCLEAASDPENENREKLLRLLDLTDEAECRKYVSILLLSEFGSCEDLIDEFLQLEDGKDSSVYLVLLFKRLGAEMEEYESNPRLDSAEFDFSKSVVFALEMLNTLCEVTYDENEKTSQRREKHELASLCTWDQLQNFVPFLTKLQNTKLKELLTLGIPDKCQEVLNFIGTRGRGVERKGIKKVSGLQSILFRISSSDIAQKVSGLVDLKKRIEKKDPEVLREKEAIVRLCEEEMQHEDPYVFMHTINVLVALGGQYHESVVPQVISEYGFEQDHPWAKKLSVTEQFALRLKLGEAMVKLLKLIGPAAVRYRNPVINVCFRLANNPDPMVRESALVVLGDLCYQLELSVTTVIVQVDLHINRNARPSHFTIIHS